MVKIGSTITEILFFVIVVYYVIALVVNVAVVVLVDPRNLSLKFGQNQVSKL